MKKSVLLMMVSLVWLTSCVEDPESYPNTYEGNFNALWEIIDTRYCFLDYKQIDWDSIYVVYHARLDTVSNEIAFFDLLGDMLDELKDGHVNLYSSFDRSRYWNWYTDYASNFSRSLIYSDRYLGDDYRIAGGIDYAVIDSGNIGYLYYESFSDNFSSDNISYIFNCFRDCRGLIVDVRNNGGGSADLAIKLASCFFTEKTLTGYICHKTGNGHSDFSEPTPMYMTPNDSLKWEKPVVVLTNRLSFSATNSFVVQMKEAPHAIIVGDSTGGGGGLPLSNELPNGWMIRFSACPMYNVNMQQTEWGLAPDVRIDLSETANVNGIDSIIEKAIECLKQ